jgi:L-iditol 2-dehydrogenase
MGCPGEAPGCLAEYIVLPEDCLYPITGRLSLEQAGLCEPVTIALHAIRQAGRLEGSLVGVLGCGPIGLCVLLAAKQAGAATVWATDRVVARVTAALRLGATWAGNPDHSDPVAEIRRQEPLGLDVVFECAGQQDTLDQATELLKPGGKLVIVGIPPMSRVSFCLDALRRKELSVLNVRRQNQRMQWAIELVASGELAVGFLVTHRFAVQQAQSAFELAAEYRDGVLKALVEF